MASARPAWDGLFVFAGLVAPTSTLPGTGQGSRDAEAVARSCDLPAERGFEFKAPNGLHGVQSSWV